MNNRNSIIRTSLLSIAASTLLSSEVFAANFSGNFSRGMDLQMSAGETTSGSFDLNGLASLIAGYDVDFSGSSHTINNISLQFSYSRAPVNGEHEYVLDEDSVSRYVQSAGPADVTYEGIDYSYEVVFSENRTYTSTMEDGQTVSAVVNGEQQQGNFIGHITYDNSTEYFVPEGTGGVIEVTNVYSNYVGPTAYGYLGSPYYFYYPPYNQNPSVANLETYDFSFTSDNGDLVLNSVNLNFSFNSVQEVPVPAAAWLFGSALLGLFGLKRR